jgi:kynurenine formamidase
VAWDALDGHDPELGSIPGHTILIVQHGIHIIESLYLEELAADGVREFGFICLPLKLRGGTGSPVRPIALVGGSRAQPEIASPRTPRARSDASASS